MKTTNKSIFTGKCILVKLADDIIDYIVYRSKAEARAQYNFWKKFGKLDPNTGEKINGAEFEII